MANATKYLNENIASPVGVWLRDGKTVYRLKEVTEGPAHRRYHEGKPLRENEVSFSVWADDEMKAINLAEKIRQLLSGAEGSTKTLSGPTPDPERREK